MQTTTIRVSRRTARILGIIANVGSVIDGSKISADEAIMRMIANSHPDAIKLYEKQQHAPGNNERAS